MKIIELKIGSSAWLQAKTASKAPAMMGQSKFCSRNQLLASMKGWKQKEHSEFLKRLFQKGHDKEDEAREIIEMQECEDYPAKTGMIVAEGMEIIASFDGLPESVIPWEHKLWNETLAENVSNSVLEPDYFWQLEQQAVVAGSDHCIFTVSDGTEDRMISMRYDSVPERREQLIAGWIQFDKDLAVFKIEAKQEKIVANEAESFPLVKFSITGTGLTSNIRDVLELVKERAEIEMSRKLETDQNFADKDKFNKSVKQARADLKVAFNQVEGEFEDLAINRDLVKQLDTILQKMQSHGERQVKEGKEAKKQEILVAASHKMSLYYTAANELIKPLDINTLCDAMVDYPGVIKGKRTIESLQNAVDTENARVQMVTTEAVQNIQINLEILRDKAGEHKMLFTDVDSLVLKDPEDLEAVIKIRIAEHKEAEKAKLEAEREKIRKEEEQKALALAEAEREKIRTEEEAKATAKAEAERIEREELERKDKAEQDEKDRIGREAEAIEINRLAEMEKEIEEGKQENKEPETLQTVLSDAIHEEGDFAAESEPKSLAKDLAEWCNKHGISFDATVELEEILKKYGVEP